MKPILPLVMDLGAAEIILKHCLILFFAGTMWDPQQEIIAWNRCC
jgi:hypothetical protein